MRFLSRKECEDYAKRIGPIKDALDCEKLCRMKRKVDFAYRSRLENAEPVGKAIVSCLGNFASALLWTHGLVWVTARKRPMPGRTGSSTDDGAPN